MNHGTSDAEKQEDAGQIHQAGVHPRQQRKARRHAFWTRVSEFLLSIPPGIAVRLGG